mmetsp:Transcript_10496/g.32606  ORF Transcript_10496/g.32606 Transcript_10496/m.32606 type:complete len:295 (-) Transcript_10496:897-1781(-)
MYVLAHSDRGPPRAALALDLEDLSGSMLARGAGVCVAHGLESGHAIDYRSPALASTRAAHGSRGVRCGRRARRRAWGEPWRRRLAGYPLRRADGRPVRLGVPEGGVRPVACSPGRKGRSQPGWEPRRPHCVRWSAHRRLNLQGRSAPQGARGASWLLRSRPQLRGGLLPVLARGLLQPRMAQRLSHGGPQHHLWNEHPPEEVPAMPREVLRPRVVRRWAPLLDLSEQPGCLHLQGLVRVRERQGCGARPKVRDQKLAPCEQLEDSHTRTPYVNRFCLRTLAAQDLWGHVLEGSR